MVIVMVMISFSIATANTMLVGAAEVYTNALIRWIDMMRVFVVAKWMFVDKVNKHLWSINTRSIFLHPTLSQQLMALFNLIINSVTVKQLLTDLASI